MKIAILSGAKKNAGDYLITKRCRQLIESVLSEEVHFEEFSINSSLDGSLKNLNEADTIVVPGGPIAQNEYPGSIPLVRNLDSIKKPIIGIGLGWYGERNDELCLNSYNFSPNTLAYVRKMAMRGTIGCRDWHTVHVMRNNGIHNPVMTGCPAWYDLKYEECTRLRDNLNVPFRKIVISDPAKEENKALVIPLVEMILKRYPSSEIHFAFHRGIGADINTRARTAKANMLLVHKLTEMGVVIHDLSYSSDGLHLYDTCDLHIGFRVHAHIYCLSQRGISVLIEEDGRGAGVNESLGLDNIYAYSDYVRGISWRKIRGRNQYLCTHIDSYLYKIEDSNFIQYKNAYLIMEERLKVMKDYISSQFAAISE